MKHFLTKTIICTALLLPSLTGCNNNELEKKGFSVAGSAPDRPQTDRGIALPDSAKFETRPSNVLLTGTPQYRLTTIYKVNYNKDGTPYIGSNDYHVNYSEISQTDGNQWHYNYLPGMEALSGYNLVNVSHFDTQTLEQRYFFDQPVLVRTLYFPSLSQDTLNHKPIVRNYFMVSVYDEDTNKDGRLDTKDLRRLYWLDKTAKQRRALIPTNYSVYKSEYDPANDYFYVFAHLDENNNGQHDSGEATHIFWIDLTNPERTGRLY